MASCQSCKALIVALKSELKELQEEQAQLRASNEYLMAEIDNEESQNQQELYWKNKYQNQLLINQALQHKVRLRSRLNKQHTSQPFRQILQSPRMALEVVKTARKTPQKENVHSRSIRKMSELMKAIVLEKANHKCKETRKRQWKKQTKRQLVLRIVDDRLNRAH